jgi:hypothetical protein
MAHGDFVDPVSQEEATEVVELVSELLNEAYQSPARLDRVREARKAKKAEDQALSRSTLTPFRSGKTNRFPVLLAVQWTQAGDSRRGELPPVRLTDPLHLVRSVVTES